jgi:hypothetical protein
MKRFGMIVAVLLMFFTMATPADAAPKPDDANHPVFPQECSGGPFDGTVTGLVVTANGGGFANGTLPTAFFYEDGDFTSDPALGVSMYRTVEVRVGDVTFITGQSRSNGNGNKAPDVGTAIQDGIDRVMSKWNVATCTVTLIPGDGSQVVVTNYVK